MNIDIKSEIQKRGLKQRFVAEALGMVETTFSNKLNGKYQFTAEEFIKLINFLGLNPKEIFKES